MRCLVLVRLTHETFPFLSFYFSEENILIIEHKLFDTKIQYNMENLLQISTKFWQHNKVCGGICSPHSQSSGKLHRYCFV